MIDGVWYVVMASTGELPQILGAHDPSQNRNPDELPTEETATDGEWAFRLVQPPADVEGVCIGRQGSTACTEQRPA